MIGVTLRPMTAEEYDAWLPGVVEDYAGDHVRMGSRPAEGAVETAQKEFDGLLPQGRDTVGHHLLVATDDDDPVGVLWLHLPVEEAEPRAFAYYVEVDKAKRGRGYGRSIMLAAESFAREHGATTIRLHVFGDNTVARRLYQRLGYQVTNVQMAKSLDA
jgi:ribosomal protein S18 acetylase RimI-like enzyme